MKKILVLFAVAATALALSCNASAQRQNVIYASLGPLANFSANDYGVGVAVGYRNYNRHSFISFVPSIEALTYVYPKDRIFGAFIVPEIGMTLGPSGFKWYPHTGLMLGYDTQTKSFAWGGKSGTAFDFGKHFTLDFSVYVPKYSFAATSLGMNLIWRF